LSETASLRCPTCGKAVDARRVGRPGDPAPFCSQRCRDADLHRWFTEKHQIPAEIDDDEPDENPPRR
jgi:uncharacterized protein